jgi:hypothetical protein
MTTRFHLESWRKLYRTLPPSWLALPLSARGLGDELLKYVDDDGIFALPPGEKEADAVCRIMCAHRDEWKRVAKDLDALVRDGYLVREAAGLCIRNFTVAQGRTPSAQRMARMRERGRHATTEQARNSDANSDATVTVTVTSQSDGSDETRRDTTREDPPVGPPSRHEPPAPIAPAVAVADPPKPKPVKAAPKGTRCPSSVDPEAPDWCRERGIPEPVGEVARMLDHFAAQPGQRGIKTDWGATWRNWQRRSAESPYGSRYGTVGTRTRQQLGLQGADAGGEY